MAERVRVAQIGCGRWGQKLLRELDAHPRVSVRLVVDLDSRARSRAATIAPKATTARALTALDEVSVDAVVVSTPGPDHFRSVHQALERGLHVFVEKPMTTSAREGAVVVALAQSAHLVGFVGHLLRYHPAVVAMLDAIHRGVLGSPRGYRSERTSLRGSRDVDGSLLWSLAPHDISVLRAIDQSQPCSIRTERGWIGIPPDEKFNHAVVSLESQILQARVSLSRATDHKVRRTTVECEHGTVVFDDMLDEGKVRVLDGAGRLERLLDYDPSRQPLREEVDAFVRAILDGERPRTGLEDGLEVVRLLEAADAATFSRSVSPPVEQAP